MNNKGFTLIEVLAVVIILSLLTLLVLPNITNSVRNFSNKTDELTFDMIEKTASLYVEDNSNYYFEREENSYCISLLELVEKGYLKDFSKYNNKDMINKKSVQVTYENGFDFKVVDNDSCVDYREICKPVTEETKTTGNLPQGDFIPGDEYLCEVKKGVNYTFFVLSIENKFGEIITDASTDKVIEKVNLILGANINAKGEPITTSEAIDKGKIEWISELDYLKNGGTVESWALGEYGGNLGNNDKGPITAINYLNNATKTWWNVININEIYDDEAGNYSNFELNCKARLPKCRELLAVNCSMYSGVSCPSWVFNYTGYSGNVNRISGINGYWLLDSQGNYPSNRAYIVYDAKINTNNVSATSWGVRPVISIPKEYIKS